MQLIVAIVASVLSGSADVGATICVLESLRSGRVLWWQFAVVAVISLVVGRYSRASLNKLAAKSVVRLRRRLVRSVLHVPLLDLERIGSSRLLVAFTSDLVGVASAVRNLASVFANSAVLLVCLGYIGWLSPARSWVAAALCVVCIVGAVCLRRLEKRHRHSSRESWDRVVQSYTMLLNGVKELKVNRPMARRVLLSVENRLRDHQKTAGQRGRYTDLVATWIKAMFYVILGIVVFGPFGNDTGLRIGYGVLALLQIRRPLGRLIVDSGAFSDAAVALQRITDLGLTLFEHREPANAQTGPAPSREFRSLELRNLVFAHDDEEAVNDFMLGPVNITLRPGEIVFIAGRNGSGKTTLAKVLTGLYPPTNGLIRMNGIAVDNRNARWYRSKFAAVFSDFCLFEDIGDPQQRDLNRALRQLAGRMKLDGWLPNAPGSSHLSTTLSAGERRRVALLMAVLEDRPIIVLDEWAADQDARYKHAFYTEVLPKIRSLGKLVIVISHDDHCFHLADRVLWLERGAPPSWTPASSRAGAAQPMPAPGEAPEAAAALDI